jgi:hypothetical protein
MKTIEELKAKADKLRSSQSGWSTSTDGSYEMALDSIGYYKLLKDIRDLEQEVLISHNYLNTITGK